MRDFKYAHPETTKHHYYAKNRERILEAQKALRPGYNTDIVWKRRIKELGIADPLKFYESELCKQGGVCKICHEPPENGVRLCIDHEEDFDHTGYVRTVKIRGLLHYECNLGLGNFRHDPILLRNAADYLGQGGELKCRA